MDWSGLSRELVDGRDQIRQVAYTRQRTKRDLGGEEGERGGRGQPKTG